MPQCRICSLDKSHDDFTITNGYQRLVCKACRNEQRRLHRSDCVSAVSLDYSVGGGSALDVDNHRDDEQYRHIEMQLRNLTAEVRTGMTNTDGCLRRIIQMEIELQNRKVRASHDSDPFWNIVLMVVLSTFLFIILRWVETTMLTAPRHKGGESQQRHLEMV
jgi:hypothetical protein